DSMKHHCEATVNRRVAGSNPARIQPEEPIPTTIYERSRSELRRTVGNFVGGDLQKSPCESPATGLSELRRDLSQPSPAASEFSASSASGSPSCALRLRRIQQGHRPTLRVLPDMSVTLCHPHRR